MAFGEHWEWRGFALESDERPSDLYRKVRSFRPLYPDAQTVTDRYIWVPGCKLNVKLRYSNFKLKRLLQMRDGGVEKWLEDEKENYSFPLPLNLLDEVADSLKLERRANGNSAANSIADGDELIAALRELSSRVEIIAVAKKRWQYELPGSDGLIVEYAEISAPETVISIGLEDPDVDRLEAGLRQLELPGTLASMNYLEALEAWGNRRSISNRTK